MARAIMNSKEIDKCINVYKQSSYEKFKNYDRFKFVFRHMLPKLKTATSFLDIGCSKGEYIYMLKEHLPHIRYCGLEYSKELIALARKEDFLSGVEFVRANAKDFNLHKKFDLVLMSGVLSIFDDYRRPLKCMLRHIRVGGFGYVFGHFNRFDIDVLVRFRNYAKGFRVWESGVNNFSIKRVRDFLSSFSKRLQVRNFRLSIDLDNKGDPTESYTMNTKERGRIITTGIGMITDFYLIIFEKK